ncbi:hypothetical protein [Blastopirellula marina]|uniref:Uncharacterized protein n=1 Tax=Blastopirellula marina TaxID=124 RepID=A0A2S8GPE4_9BACT|nr:hypothetical protein [Blastopirellula marina]PQO45874.1 hypothetical protein C5Y93_11490 [Blastopirellula marina]
MFSPQPYGYGKRITHARKDAWNMGDDMLLFRYVLAAVGGLLLLVGVAAGSYHCGYSTCYSELNQLNRGDVGNLLAPGDQTMIVRDLQRHCLDLENQLIAAQREVRRLTEPEYQEALTD